MKFGKRKQSNFNPTHDQVKTAMCKYFESGGKVTRIKNLRTSYLDFMAIKSAVGTADDFLLGN